LYVVRDGDWKPIARRGRAPHDQRGPRVAAAETGPRLDGAAIRSGLAQMAQDVRSRADADAALGREAILALIAQDERGHQRLDVIEDASAPGGYRIEGTLRIPIVINSANSNERAADQREADQRLRMLVAGEGYAPTDLRAIVEIEAPFPIAA
jgi:hypothetical protein